MNEKGGYVYMMSNKIRSVFYIGVTSNLHNRVQEHKSGVRSVFTKKYNCFDLLYYQFFETTEIAIAREKKMKEWNRFWKDNLIKDFNPNLVDLSDTFSEMQ